jgi:hypothetical protein
MKRERKKGLQLPIFLARIIRNCQRVKPLSKEGFIMRLIEPACHLPAITSSGEAGGLQGTSGQVYLPTETQQMLKDSGKVSPSCRLYEPEAESRLWAGEKTPVESVRRVRSQLSTTLISGI